MQILDMNTGYAKIIVMNTKRNAHNCQAHKDHKITDFIFDITF